MVARKLLNARPDIHTEANHAPASPAAPGHPHPRPGTALAVPAYTVTDLGTLGGLNSSGSGINARGQVTGTSDTAARNGHAFLWDPAAGMQDLGTLGGGGNSTGAGINARGQVTGYSTTAGFAPLRAHLWDPAAGMRDLGTLGGAESIGFGINAKGQV